MQAKLTHGNVGGHLIRLAAPLAVGIFAVMGFNIIDTYFVGQLGSDQLAAISFTFPVVTFLGSVSFGIGIGVGSLVSRSLGSGNIRRVKTLATDSLSLGLILAFVLTLAGLLTIDPLFIFLGAGSDILPYIREYMEIWYWSLVFVIIPMVGTNILRSTGDTFVPALIMIGAGVVNLILDPLLIFGYWIFPRLELSGAAYATVLSRATTMVFTIWVLTRGEGHLYKVFRPWKEVIKHWLEILKISLPAAINNSIVPVSVGIVTILISPAGPEAVAGFGVASRIEAFSMILVMASAASLGPFVGQNWGAGFFGRIEEALRLAHRFGFMWIGLVFIWVAFFAGPTVSVFSENSTVQEYGKEYLWIVTLSLAFQGLTLNNNASFNSIGKTQIALAISFVRVFMLYLPLALLLRHWFGITGVFLSVFLTNVVVGVASTNVFRRVFEKARPFRPSS